MTPGRDRPPTPAAQPMAPARLTGGHMHSGFHTPGAAARARARTRRGVLLAALLVLAVGLAIALLARDGEPPTRVAAARTPPAPVPVAPGLQPATVAVRVDGSHTGRPVPLRYMGLSFEVAALPEIARMGERGDLVALLRSLGPGVLRFGGVSADTRTAWVDASTPRPAWASGVIGPADLKGLRQVAQRSGWPVLLTVGLAHYSPAVAGREVAAARAALGPWLAGVEVGNEADAYARHGLRRPASWGRGAYVHEARAYMSAIRRAAGPVPLDAPGVSGSHAFARWAPATAAVLSPQMLTGHHYPLGCKQTPGPSIPRLLSPGVRAAEQRSLQRYMRVAHLTGLPFRMDELNSVSCGGTEGISNVFASALWASGYIGSALSAGVTGLNFEGAPAWCRGYSALCAPTPARLAAGALQAQPLYYALLLARGLGGDRPVRVHVTAGRSHNVSVSAFRAPSAALTLLALDAEPAGAPPARLVFDAGGGYPQASVTRLAAPSVQSGTGITLGGRSVGPSGTLGGEPAQETGESSGGSPSVLLAPSSAALITLAKSPGSRP